MQLSQRLDYGGFTLSRKSGAVQGVLKGKSALHIHRQYLGKQRNFTGFHFWALGYCVSTVGLDEATIRQYIRNQEAEEKRQEQLTLGGL